MPTPLLHTSIGVAAAVAAEGPRPSRKTLALTIVAANAADLDIIPGALMGDSMLFHHGAVHSALAALALTAALAWLGRARLPALLAAALSHPLLDLLCVDLPGYPTGREGLPLLWPFGTRWQPLRPVFKAMIIPARGTYWIFRGVPEELAKESAAALLLLALGAVIALARKRAGSASAESFDAVADVAREG